MTRHDKKDFNMHIAILGLLVAILSAVIALAYYFGVRDEKIGVNTRDITDIKTTVQRNSETLTDIYIILKSREVSNGKEKLVGKNKPVEVVAHK